MKHWWLPPCVIAFICLSSFAFLFKNWWRVSLEKDIILSSSANRKGDIAVIQLAKISSDDTLYVQHFMCGLNGYNALTALTVRNMKGEIIDRSESRNKKIEFRAQMPVKSILTSDRQLSVGDTLNVYFEILNAPEAFNFSDTTLLFRLKLQ